MSLRAFVLAANVGLRASWRCWSGTVSAVDGSRLAGRDAGSAAVLGCGVLAGRCQPLTVLPGCNRENPGAGPGFVKVVVRVRAPAQSAITIMVGSDCRAG